MTAPANLPPNVICWQNLINACRYLLNPERTNGPPTDEHIRRAVSSAHHALFHGLDVNLPAPCKATIATSPSACCHRTSGSQVGMRAHHPMIKAGVNAADVSVQLEPDDAQRLLEKLNNRDEANINVSFRRY
jgi:hypothetical protein